MALPPSLMEVILQIPLFTYFFMAAQEVPAFVQKSFSQLWQGN